MKSFILLLSFVFFLFSAGIHAQSSQLNIVSMHQLIDQSQAEHSLQVDCKNSQAIAAMNEQANLTLLVKLKNVYRTLQQRYNILGTVIDIAEIGIRAKPMVNKIIYYQAQIISLAQQNPANIAMSYQSEILFAKQAESLLGYMAGISLSIDDVNQMKASDRKLLLDYVITELSAMQHFSATLVNTLQYSNLSAQIKSLNPYQNFINQDKTIANSILQNAKYLKK